MKSAKYFILWAVIAVIKAHAENRELIGRVVHVVDGDTLDVLVDNSQLFRVRLNGMDAPEKSQAFGSASKRSMMQMTLLKTARVIWVKHDRNKRIVGKVMIGQKDVGLSLISEGLAWHFKRYQVDQSAVDRQLYSSAEELSRRLRRGLWSQPNPIPPWEFRSRTRK